MPTTRFDKDSIKESIIGKLQRYNGRSVEEAAPQQLYKALASTVRDQIMQKWMSYKEKEKKEQGKKLYYLSNYSSPAFERTMTRFPFFSLFDGGIVSAREHMVKPMPAIYLLLCERYGFSPEDALFVDDSGANTEAARRLGFSVWQYQGEDL